MQRTMIYRYLKEEKIEQYVKNYTLNTKKGAIHMEF